MQLHRELGLDCVAGFPAVRQADVSVGVGLHGLDLLAVKFNYGTVAPLGLAQGYGGLVAVGLVEVQARGAGNGGSRWSA